MKKISKIILENFRVFSGKNEINFNNSNGEPADFVCVYGKNGSGKSTILELTITILLNREEGESFM